MSVSDFTASPVAELFGEFASSELPTNNHSNALAASLTVCSGPAYLVAFTVNNTNAAAQFIQLHDANVLPADGSVPAVVFTASASSDKFVTYSLPGRFFQRGIVVCNSSTAATKTVGAADCFFDVQFIPIVR
jgi:hypothetical protein